MSYIGQGLPSNSFIGYTTDTFAGDGSATTFTMSKAPFNESAVIVVINNVVQQPTADFTVSGTTLTIDAAVADGDVIYATHTGGAIPINTASALDLNGASDQLILDADADTTISADTDDQIDFKAGGTDIMSLTATTVTINDGTTITVADNSDTLTLVSTDADASSGPNFRMYRNSGSPADSDILGVIEFEGRNDNSQDVRYVQLTSQVNDITDGTEDGSLYINTMIAGAMSNRINLRPTETVINEEGKALDFRVESVNSNNFFFLDQSAQNMAILESAGDQGNGGLCLNQGSADGYLFTAKSSDIAHGMTDFAEADTYFGLRKANGTIGGAILRGVTEGEQAIQIQGMADSANTTKSTAGGGIVAVTGYVRNGTSIADPGSDANLFVVNQGGNAQFIVDTEGQLHSNGGAQSAYDTYEDAHLVRAFDLSHGKGVIDSKFDKFISYNHEKLADMKLVGREEDGTPNHFINVTGMQRLHNGAIWQQYEKTEKLTNAMYELAKAAVGEEKANEILEQNDIKLLN